MYTPNFKIIQLNPSACNQYVSKQKLLNSLLTSLCSCASVAAAPPCRLVVNATAAYPFCCPRYDCSRLTVIAEADAKENEVDTGEGGLDEDGDVMYMSGSHPAVDYEAVQYDVDLGGGDSSSGGEDDEVREQLLAKRSKLTNYVMIYELLYQRAFIS